MNVILKTVQCLKQLEMFIKSTTKATKLDEVQYKVIGILFSNGSSGGSCVFSLATVAVLDFSQPFAIWCFPLAAVEVVIQAYEPGCM